MARLAWFSPVPPVRSGIAACSAELIAALDGEHQIDVFVDEPIVRSRPGTRSAHDFVWLNRQRPYDLTIFQLGNSSHHDYQWPYVFRFPGLAVLHDVCLHHARAASLLRTGRAAEYRTEFALNHPEARRDFAEVAAAGFDTHLYYLWPMTRLVAMASRLVAVHTRVMKERLHEEVPSALVEVIHLGHGTSLSPVARQAARQRVRTEYGIPPESVVFGCFGGLTPEKRIPQMLAAFAATRQYYPSARLMLVGAAAEHYDIHADIRRFGVDNCTTLTGYVDSESELTACIAACDVAVNLRWPTAREVSGPWLRCLALGKPTIITDLAHLGDVPSLDPRTWLANATAAPPARERDADPPPPICVAIDIMDEDHSLRLAMRRLGTDPALRAMLGSAAREYWTRQHRPGRMTDDYRRVIGLALERERGPGSLPPHLLEDGGRVMRAIAEQFGLPSPLE